MSMHACPTCGSARHLLCAEGYTVHMTVRVGIPASQELGADDAVVELRCQNSNAKMEILLAHEEALCAAERRACTAFGDALIEASLTGTRRLFVDMRGESQCDLEVAAVFHCRLATLILCADLKQLQEVVLCVSPEQEPDIASFCRTPGPLCMNCPHFRC